MSMWFLIGTLIVGKHIEFTSRFQSSVVPALVCAREARETGIRNTALDISEIRGLCLAGVV